jgi:hypothetical protein
MPMMEEGKKQLVGLLFTALTVVVISVTARFMDDPDAVRSLKMRTATRLKGVANKTALTALNVADYADSVYESGRS